jgi:hypothetical protein
MVLTSFLFDVFSSFVASLIFLFAVLFLFKPLIRVSPFICKNQSEFQNEGMVYCIKIVNISLFTAYEIKMELSVLERYPTPPSGMTNKRMRPLKLVLDSYSNLSGFRPQWLRKEADHCLRFRTKEDLNAIIQDPHKSIHVQIMVRHGLTGLASVFTQEYSDLNQIREGKFAYGTKFDIM